MSSVTLAVLARCSQDANDWQDADQELHGHGNSFSAAQSRAVRELLNARFASADARIRTCVSELFLVPGCEQRVAFQVRRRVSVRREDAQPKIQQRIPLPLVADAL
eukprot:932875-Rhodomonas_salina.3